MLNVITFRVLLSSLLHDTRKPIARKRITDVLSIFSFFPKDNNNELITAAAIIINIFAQ